MQHKVRDGEQGLILLVTLVIALALAGFSSSLLVMMNGENKRTRAAQESMKALYAAEAGVSDAIADLIAGGTGSRQGQLAGASYVVTAVDNGDGTFALDSRASYGGNRYAIDTVVVPVLIPLSIRGAVSLYGPDVELDLDAKSGALLIDGSPGQIPAINVEDPAAYADAMDDIAMAVKTGKLDEAMLQGDPLVPWTDPMGDTIHVPVSNDSGSTLDPVFWEDLRLSLVDQTLNDWIPNADGIFYDDHVISTPLTFGTAASPEIVVVEGTNVDVDAGGSISGYGTLIVTGELHFDDGGLLDWHGDIVVLGGHNLADKHAEFENHNGDVTINGNIFVVGADGGDAEFEIDDHDGVGGLSHTLINGSVVVLSGPTGEEAQVEIEEGNTEINGLIAVIGSRDAEFELTNDDNPTIPFAGNLTVNGAIFAGVTDPAGRVDFEVEGNSQIIFDQVQVDAALDGLNQSLGSLPTTPEVERYSTLLWRRSTVAGYGSGYPYP